MVSLNSLPDGGSTDLVLVHPTFDEKLHQFKLNSVEWRGALSHEAYLRREHVLSKQALTQDDGITYWILIDKTATPNALEPTSPRLPLASCETYRKRALVWRDGKVEETICHGVGSVFCAPQLRGRRYAQRMMQDLSEVLKTHQMTEERVCLFSVLFSDIGKNFYAKYGGWKPFASSHVAIPAENPRNANLGDMPVARPLHAGDLAELCAIDETLIRRNLEARPRDSNVAVALIPDVETMQWHHAREEFVGAELHGKEPEIKGAMVSDKGRRAWMYWTRVWSNSNPQETQGNTLHVLRLVLEGGTQAGWQSSNEEEYSPDQEGEAMVMSLLVMAQREADEWKMEQVEVWNPSRVTVAAARRLYPTAECVHREDSIASLKWYGEHNEAVAPSLEVDWVCNEKYGWC